MGLEIHLQEGTRTSGVVDIHHLSHYVFDSREPIPKRGNNPADSADRLQSSFGCRVAGVLLVCHSHVFLLTTFEISGEWDEF